MINSNVLLSPAAKRVELINYPDESEAFGGTIVPIASSVGWSEATKALSE